MRQDTPGCPTVSIVLRIVFSIVLAPAAFLKLAQSLAL
jgi:hypothetical protein